MASPPLHVRSVAVVGAGISGVAAGIHLKRAGLNVTIYERSPRAGGIWVFDERSARDPAYPSVLPSVGDSPEFVSTTQRETRQDSPLRHSGEDADDKVLDDDVRLSFAPPGPCYIALKNNVSTTEMEISCQAWKPGTDEFVPHHILADYIQDAAIDNGISKLISFNTRVKEIQKAGDQWRVDIARLPANGTAAYTDESSQLFDAVVIASGHYHACNVPDLPGLSNWKQSFPGRIRHSKSYRRPEEFKGQNVLLIGAGVSSMDIARDLGPHARAIYQSSRGGPYDLPSHLLPSNAARIGGVEKFGDLSGGPLTSDTDAGSALPGVISLRNGQELCNIDQVIVCTGYHVSLPFMRQYHADGTKAADAEEDILVTDGQQVHNLHKDIWYIEDPTLAFVGVPYHVATFSLFDFQAQALASVFSGKVALPSREAMRLEYNERVQKKGAGRTFHSLKARGDEIAYVKELVETINAGQSGSMQGHTERWVEAYGRRVERQKALFSQVRDSALDQKAMELMTGCR